MHYLTKITPDLNPVEDLSITLPPSFSRLRTIYLSTEPPISEHDQISQISPHISQSPSLFPVIALGGTFDHLHAGHKILLSMAAWIASEKIIVGITGKFFTSSGYPYPLTWQPRRRSP